MTTATSPGLAASPGPLTAAYDVALLDLDGVVYLGDQPIDGVAAAVAAHLGELRLAYVTNNATRTPAAVWRQLDGMGLPGSAEDVVTSCQAAARLLAEELPEGSPVLVVGSDALAEAVAERRLRPVATVADQPAAVVQGLSLQLRYEQLAEAALAIRAGLPWIATNADSTLPTDRGLLPGNGSLVAALVTATGRRPRVAGKPEPTLFVEAADRMGAQRPLVVGDRTDTDIEGAVRAGMDSLLVLSGVHRPADVLRAPRDARPTYLGLDLGALMQTHPAVGVADGTARCAGWEVRREGAELVLAGDGAAIDALRALAAAAWAGEDGELRVRGRGAGAVAALAALDLPGDGGSVA